MRFNKVSFRAYHSLFWLAAFLLIILLTFLKNSVYICFCNPVLQFTQNYFLWFGTIDRQKSTKSVFYVCRFFPSAAFLVRILLTFLKNLVGMLFFDCKLVVEVLQIAVCPRRHSCVVYSIF